MTNVRTVQWLVQLLIDYINCLLNLLWFTFVFGIRLEVNFFVMGLVLLLAVYSFTDRSP